MRMVRLDFLFVFMYILDEVFFMALIFIRRLGILVLFYYLE